MLAFFLSPSAIFLHSSTCKISFPFYYIASYRFSYHQHVLAFSFSEFPGGFSSFTLPLLISVLSTVPIFVSSFAWSLPFGYYSKRKLIFYCHLITFINCRWNVHGTQPPNNIREKASTHTKNNNKKNQRHTSETNEREEVEKIRFYRCGVHMDSHCAFERYSVAVMFVVG